MLHNFFFIRKLSLALNERLSGWKIGECFSQNKNELVIGFFQDQKQLYLRANLDPNTNLITFSEDFQRAKKNSVDLYPSLLDRVIDRVVQVPFDRSFYLELEGGDQLIFKLHGRRSNIIHRAVTDTVDLFRNKLATDLQVTPQTLARTVKLDATDAQGYTILRQVISKQYLDEDRTDHEVKALADRLMAADQFYIYQKPSRAPGVSLLPVDHTIAETKDPLEACNLLFRAFMQGYLFQSEKESIDKELEKQQQRAQHYIERNERELQSLRTKRSYEEVANIIMANLHQLPPNGGETELHDFYSDKPIKIKIRQGVTPQKHAENLYRKAKNQKIQLQKLQENIDLKLEQMASIEAIQAELRDIDDFKALRSFQKRHHVEKKSGQEDEANLPYKERIIQGYQVLIGKNAKANDELTLRHAKKDDLWLHARDVPGSHVVIRKPGKSNIPDLVIEKAAELAAYYSKRKSDSLCPVIVTPRKYVRKRKGAAAGEVIVDREEVVMVRPASG
ncbi:MAG: NFACT RNA binding domain-containing protein [Bacteroidota bacterium]